MSLVPSQASSYAFYIPHFFAFNLGSLVKCLLIVIFLYIYFLGFELLWNSFLSEEKKRNVSLDLVLIEVIGSKK